MVSLVALRIIPIVVAIVSLFGVKIVHTHKYVSILLFDYIMEDIFVDSVVAV